MPDKKAALRRCNHEGSLRQRKDGRWEVRLTVPSWKGPPRRCSYYFSRKADAVAMLRGQISAYDNLGPGGSPRLKVSQWLWTWLMEIKKPDIRPSTYNLYESILNKHLAGLGQFIEQIIHEHYEKGDHTMAKTRTMAFQISEELFQRIKEYLTRYEQVYGRRLTQKEFVLSLIENALDEADEEFEAATATEDTTPEAPHWNEE